MQSSNDVSVRVKNQDVKDNLACVLIMVNETPKKIVDEILKCFTCSSLCSADRRIFLVGKTSHNFVEIIKSALNVDINCYVYDKNNTLFVCKTSCYKWLLKFQRASEKVEEIGKEIQHAFQARPRAKRLPRPSDGNDDEINDEQRSVCKMGLTGLQDSQTVRGICTFADFFAVSRPFCRFTLIYEGRFILCCKEKIEPLDRVMANLKRS